MNYNMEGKYFKNQVNYKYILILDLLNTLLLTVKWIRLNSISQKFKNSMKILRNKFNIAIQTKTLQLK
jgi:hypothetical protein